MKNKFFKVISLITFIIFFYTIYKSEIINNGYLRSTYYINYIVIAFLFILNIIFLKSNSELKKIIIIGFITLLVSLIGIEIYLNFNNLQNEIDSKNLKKIYLYKKKQNKVFDQRTKLQIFKDKKKEGYWPNITPSNYLEKEQGLFPISGMSNAKIINCNENGYFSKYTSDYYGFNNYFKKWPNEIDFFLIGDSFVNGSCVNEEDTITYQLLKNFNYKKKIINTGMAGNGPLIEYASFREYSKNKKIKNLIYFYYEGNDMGNFFKEINNPILKNYLKDKNFHQDLINKQNLINNIHKKNIDLKFDNQNKEKKKNNYKEILKLQKLRFLVNNFFFKYQGIFLEKDFIKILTLLKDDLDKRNINFYFVYIPEFSRFLESDYTNKNFYNYGKIKGIINSKNIKLIDLIEEINKRKIDPKKLYPFGMHGHFNEYGYQKISNIIFEKLNEK